MAFPNPRSLSSGMLQMMQNPQAPQISILSGGRQQTQADDDAWNQLMGEQQRNIVRTNMAAAANPWIDMPRDYFQPLGRHNALQAELNSRTAGQRGDAVSRMAGMDQQREMAAAQEAGVNQRQQQQLASAKELAGMEQEGREKLERERALSNFDLEYFTKHGQLPPEQIRQAFANRGKTTYTSQALTAPPIGPGDVASIININKDTMKLDLPGTIARMSGMTMDESGQRNVAQALLKYMPKDVLNRDLTKLLAEEASRASRVDPMRTRMGAAGSTARLPELPEFTGQFGDYTVNSPQRPTSWNPFANPSYEFSISGPGMKGTHGIVPGLKTRADLRSETPEQAGDAKRKAETIAALLKAYRDAQMQAVLAQK